ncbi:MAG: helix-turn-helix domain-containing protein [Monoglobales bacterium]
MKKFIDENIDKNLSVKILSAQTGYNEKYFIDVFKKSFGATPAQYVKTLRLEKAKHELLYTDSKTSMIASKIGYSSIQKLSKDFKACTGFSPTEFRKRFK